MRSRFSIPVTLLQCALVLCVVLLVLQAADRQAATPLLNRQLLSTQYLQPQSETREAPTQLTLATFNIHSGKGRDEVCNLERTHSAIPAGIDLLFLQEVRSGLHGLRTDQTSYLAEKLEYAHLFLPTEQQYFENHFGNALLTRTAPQSIHYLPLPNSLGKRFRNATLLTLDICQPPLRVLLTHLDEKVDRAEQLPLIVDLFNGLEAPVVLMGDLNTRVGDELLAPLWEEPDVLDALASCTADREDGHGVDWILTKGLKVIDQQIVETDASDHPLFTVTIEIPRFNPDSKITTQPVNTVLK